MQAQTEVSRPCFEIATLLDPRGTARKRRSKWKPPSATPEQVQRMVDNLPWHVSNRIWVSQTSGCWLWAGADSGTGRGGEYGRVSLNGKTTAVHILLYERLYGKIKGKRKYLDHRCRTRNCCNPGHLEQVTHRMNCARRDAAQRKLKRNASTIVLAMAA